MTLYKKNHPKNRISSVQFKSMKHCTELSKMYDFMFIGK